MNTMRMLGEVDGAFGGSTPALLNDVVVTSNGIDPVVVADPSLLFRADFQRDGSDLLLVNSDAVDVRIVDYFSHNPVAITTAEGGRLSAAVVERLAGPQAPGEVAQAQATEAALPIGQVEQVRGDAQVLRTDGTQVPLEVGTFVFEGDVVSTDEDGSLSITFVDETQFTLTANARLVLDELIYSPEGEDNSAVFNLVEGGFVFVAGQVAKTGDMSVETPSATLGIRGTTVLVEVSSLLGVMTVAVTLVQDFDTLEAGVIELRDLSGNLITTITSTETTWVVPLGNDAFEVARSVNEDADDVALLADAAAAFASVVERLEAGELPVNVLDTRSNDPVQDGKLTADEPTDPDLKSVDNDDPGHVDLEGQDSGDTEPSGQTEGPTTSTTEDTQIDEPPAPEDTSPQIGSISVGTLDENVLLNAEAARSVSGSLAIDFGNDGNDSAADGQFQDTPTGPDTNNKSIVFADASVGGDGAALTSGGTQVTYSLTNNNTVLEASAGGSVVFLVRLSDDDNGGFTFTLFESLDNPGTTNSDDLELTFNFIAADDDDDETAGSFSVVVQDGVPVAKDVDLVIAVNENTGFDEGFDGWNIINGPQTGPNGEQINAPTYEQSATINTTENLIPGDNTIADLSFQGTLTSFGDGPNIGTAFGPSLISDPFSGIAGDVVAFEYVVFGGTGSGTGDDAVIEAVLVRVDEQGNATGQEIEVFSDNTPILGTSQVLQQKVEIDQSGDYRIEFRIGSFDGTDGGVIGARIAIGTAGIIRNNAAPDVEQVFDALQFTSSVDDVDGDAVMSLDWVESTSTFGANVALNSDGNVVYTPVVGSLDQLAEGEQVTDTFDFTLSDQNGSQSTATANVTVVGVNDAPIIESVTIDASGKSGHIIFSDVDNGDTPEASASPNLSGNAVTFTPAEGSSTTLSSTQEDDALKSLSLTDPATGEWAFDESVLNGITLQDGDILELIYTITVTDDLGLTDEVGIVITITGVEDGGAPLISASEQYTGNDPIVLDLDGDGVELIAPNVSFDLNADSTAETIGWVGADDGLLVVDHNGNGSIEDGSEVFSEVFAGGSYQNSLEALASLDRDGNGIIDKADTDFGDIKVWQDINGDGKSNEGELKTLGEHGIASIDLQSSETDKLDAGNTVFAEGNYTKTDGSVGQYAGVAFGTAAAFQLSDDPLPVLPSTGSTADAGQASKQTSDLPSFSDLLTTDDGGWDFTQLVAEFSTDDSPHDPASPAESGVGSPDAGQTVSGGEVAGFVVPSDDDTFALETAIVA